MTRPRAGPVVRICSMQKTLRVPRRKITDIVAFVARCEGVRVLEADVAVVCGEEMARLNEQYLGHAGATDVLSFDLSDASDPRAGLSAQIIVCGDLAAAEAAKRNISTRRELLLYVVHALLHLMGYDDTDPRAAARMRARQAELLEAFGRQPPPPGHAPAGRCSV